MRIGNLLTTTAALTVTYTCRRHENRRFKSGGLNQQEHSKIINLDVSDLAEGTILVSLTRGNQQIGSTKILLIH